ncbi:hypothetical protein KCU65_g3302, partial [Aureobasidium melanogenum]
MVQIGIGKQHSGKPFERTGALKLQPLALQQAVSVLEAKSIRESLDLYRLISHVLEKNPLTRKHYYEAPGRPGDLLFRRDYAHAQPGKSCSSCDLSNLVARDDRDDNQEPRVHYGLIASTNFIIKDANLRDQICTELDAICLDITGQGLIDTLPCLVIRGVADYADTHKNDEWVDYAAFAASAYTEKLLSVITETSIRAMELVTFADLDQSSARYLILEPGNAGSMGSDNDEPGKSIDDPANTISDNMTGGKIAGIFTATRVAQVMASNERLRSVCAPAALRIERHALEQNLYIASNVFSKALENSPQTSLILALRWLFSIYRLHITTDMAETFYDREDLLNRRQAEVAPIPDEVLMHLLSDRFPAASITDPAVNRAHSKEVPIATLNPDQMDMDIFQAPEYATLADLGHSDEVLCRGEAFEDMLGKLKELLLPPVHVMLENILDTYLAGTPGDSKVITCLVEWELLQLVESEGLDVKDIDSLFTLSGDFEDARADPLAEHKIWDTGRHLLETVKACLIMASKGVFDPTNTKFEAEGLKHQTQMQLFSGDMTVKNECAVVSIKGSADQIKSIVRQLAWLTTTLRVPQGETLTVSCVNFQPQRTQNGQIMEGVFRMSLWEQDKVPRPNDAPGECWTRLFAQSVLAYGFPSSATDRPERMRGLEIPFEIMATFAGVRFPLLLGERLAFAGETHILVPEMFSENSVQWHFDTIENALQHTETKREIQASGLESIDLSNIHRYRAFLGYSRLSEVVIGTAEFCNAMITPTDLPRPKRELRFKNEGTLTAGLGYKGYITSSAGTTWKLKPCEVAMIEGSTLSLDEVLHRSARSPALLYDDQNSTAFLLSELSIIIQMAATYLQSESDVAADQIPRAYRSCDGGKAAYEAVKAAKNLDVPFGTGEPRKYPDIVRDFIDLLEQRKKQKQINESDFRFSRERGLKGWSYTDIQEKSFQFWERELRTDSQPIWWELFRDSNTIVLFAGSMPQPIRICHDQTTPFCTSWDAIPAHHHLLLANVVVLKRLRIIIEKARKKYSDRYMLTANLAWARPAKSRLFETNCTPGGRCNPLQTIRDLNQSWWRLDKMRWLRSADHLLHYLSDPGQLEDQGSVLFADDPSVFEDRLCEIVNPRGDSPHTT